MPKRSEQEPRAPETLQGISESAQEVWARGVAAFEQAQREGGRFLSALLEEGERIRTRTRGVAENAVDEVRESTGETWDRLEKIFDDRVSRALFQLGIPTRGQLAALARRIEGLEQQVAALQGHPIATEQGGASRRSSEPGGDNLQRLKGLGPATAARLQAHGITTFRQLARLSPEAIAEIERGVLHSGGSFARNGWQDQARRLHREEYKEEP